MLCALGAAALLLTGAYRSAGDGLPGTVLAAVALALTALIVWAALGLALVRRPASAAVTLRADDAPEFHTMIASLAADLGVPAPDAVRVCP
ncbi:MAG: peptidase M48, partial [Streptomycetaceae bacterium]|nr:peptidase M48 [Streptomycetaceae bacterium]